MAHGTGYYWNRIWDADLQTKEYAVISFRLYHYYHEQMSDCYEPTSEAMDEYRVEVIKWRKDAYGHLVADHVSDSTDSGSITKEEANKIWWNLKHKNISFEAVRKYFERS